MMKLAIEISRLDIELFENNLYYDVDGQLFGEISYKVNKSVLTDEIKDELDNNQDLLLGYKLDIIGEYVDDVNVNAWNDTTCIKMRVDEIKHVEENIILIMEIL